MITISRKRPPQQTVKFVTIVMEIELIKYQDSSVSMNHSDLSNIAINKLCEWIQALPSLLNSREKIISKITSELESS